MKSFIFCDISQCSPLKVNRRFGGTRLHPQGWGVNQARNQYEAGSKQGCASSWFLVWFTLQLWGSRRDVTPKRPLIFNWLHAVISQKIEFFITTVVRISGPTCSYVCCSWGKQILVDRNPQDNSHLLVHFSRTPSQVRRSGCYCT
jgi:hypothetical protein